MSEAGDPLDPARDRIVLAALPNVPFDGWSWRCLRAAAKAEGLDETMAERVFPHGPVDAVVHFAALADRRLAEEAKAADLAAMRFTQRIAWLVRRRLEAWSDHREAVRRAIGLLALPGRAAAAARSTWRTADAIWYAAGDSSTDFSFYTRRVTLGAVYAATLLCWLDDKSESSTVTWEFLDRRLAGVGQIGKLRAKATERLKRAPNPLRDLAKLRAGSRGQARRKRSQA